MRKVIIWTASEKEALIQEATRLMMLGIVKPNSRAVQDVLPPHRRRVSSSIYSTLAPIWKEARKLAAAVRQPEPSSVPLVYSKARGEDQITMTPSAAPVDSPLDALATEASEWIAEVLVSAMRSPRVLAAARDLLGVVTNKPAPAPEPTEPWVDPAPARQEGKVRRTRVVIVGPLPQQFAALEKANDGRLDLRFYNKDHAHQQLKHMAKHCDFAVLMIGFISHRHEQTLRSLMPPDKVLRANGGVTSVIKTLEGIK